MATHLKHVFAPVIALTLTTISFISGSGDSISCGNCTCLKKEGMIEANCSNLNLWEIPDFGNLNKLVDNLYLSKNNIIGLYKNNTSHLTNVSSLHLDYNRISEIEPGVFLQLKKLADLKLNQNSLSIIKTGMFRDLPSLSTLRLGVNKIVAIEKDAFVNLPKLTMLDLTNNTLSSIRGESLNSLPSLNTLFLYYNQFSDVPGVLCQKLPALKRLYLKGNYISVIKKLDFAHCFNLTYILLANNQIENIHEYGFSVQMSGSVSKPLPLETIDLTQNKLTSVPTAPLRYLTTLRHLSMSRNLFRVIPSGAFGNLPDLTIIHLSNNVNLETIEPGAFRGLFRLSQVFITNNRRLRTIPEYAFHDSTQIHALFLETNSLMTLYENILPDWAEVRILNIHSNNFECSCDLLWIKDSKLMEKKTAFDQLQDIQCTLSGKTENILSLKLECSTSRHAKSRVITGLIAAGITACILLACLAVISFRRRIYSKYIHLKYHRQRDDPLFTVEDPKSKRKIFTKNMDSRDHGRDETLM